MSVLPVSPTLAPVTAAAVAAPGFVIRVLAARGAIAGCFGAGTLAIWFLVIDLLTRQQPMWSPSLVGATILQGASPSAPVAIDLGVTAAFSVVHCLMFAVFGIASATALHRLNGQAWSPFGVAALAVSLLGGFALVAAVLAPGLGSALGWVYLLGGNVAAAISMALCFAALPAVEDVRPR